MSLSKQIIFGMIGIISIAFIGLFLSQMQATQTFIERQLASHAQDTATSLGLAISPSMLGLPDIATMDTMVNVIFDRGFYQSITLTDAQNNILIQKSNPSLIDSVPNWFQLMFALDAPTIESTVSNGWTIQGTLSIQSHAGYAYEQLYSAAFDNAMIFGMGLLLTISFSIIMARMIIGTLANIQQHSEQLSQGKFTPISAIPRTPELKNTVLCVNAMTSALANQQQQLTDDMQRFKHYALTDKPTKTANRRAFEATLKRILAHEDTLANGTIYIIRLTSLANVTDKLGFAAQQQYTLEVVDKIQSFFEHTALPQVYRLNDADFAVMSDTAKPAQRIEQISELYQHIKHVDKSEYQQGVVAIGAGEFKHGLGYDIVMTRADNALTCALANEPAIFVHNPHDPACNKTQWREILADIIDQESIEFVSQTVNQSNNVMYQEWFTRFNQTTEHSTADIFANAHKHGYMLEFDKLIVKHALAKLTKSPAKIALNLSRMALCDPDFQAWFFDVLPVSPTVTSKLIIEIPERALVDNFQHIADFMAQAKIRYIQFTIERFGAQLASVQHLKALRPDYVKLDPRYTFAIHLEDEQQRLVKTLVEVAHGLGIKVIAEQVETEAQALCLEALQVDCLQGFEISQLEQVF